MLNVNSFWDVIISILWCIGFVFMCRQWIAAVMWDRTTNLFTGRGPSVADKVKARIHRRTNG